MKKMFQITHQIIRNTDLMQARLLYTEKKELESTGKEEEAAD